jgi:hypothetical protein
MSLRLGHALRQCAVLVGVLTLLLPGSWDLCVGSDHRALEPSRTCSGGEATDSGCDTMCGPEEEACNDTPIFDGLALRGAPTSDDEPLQLLSLLDHVPHATGRLACLVDLASWIPPVVPPLETIALRC